VAKHVLFVCFFNQSRSLIAELLLREMLRNQGDASMPDITVSSAGFLDAESLRWFDNHGIPLPNPLFNQPASPATQIVLLKRGIDISSHFSREIDKEILDNSDIIIPFFDSQKRSIISLYPETKPKIFLPKELVNQETSFVWEDENYEVPLDISFFDFVNSNIGYAGTCVRQLGEFLYQALPKILSLLGANT
jgi:protein-tyrosine-phosphatase